MTDGKSDSFVIPAALSPAAAEETRAGALRMLEAAQEDSGTVTLEVDGDALTPCAVQILISAGRTAERMGLNFQISEQGQKALSELQTN